MMTDLHEHVPKSLGAALDSYERVCGVLKEVAVLRLHPKTET
jgi:hypothetical protein